LRPRPSLRILRRHERKAHHCQLGSFPRPGPAPGLRAERRLLRRCRSCEHAAGGARPCPRPRRRRRARRTATGGRQPAPDPPRRGELAALGHPDYGSRHHELMGEPNIQRTRDLIKLYVLQALAAEPRIEKVLSATVVSEQIPPRDTVRIELKLQVIGAPTPLN